MKTATVILTCLVALLVVAAAGGAATARPTATAAATPTTAASPAAVAGLARRDLLAHAAGGQRWVGRVVPRPVPMRMHVPEDPGEQTRVWTRSDGPGQRWRFLSVVAGRVTGMAGKASQLAVLLDNGAWAVVWAGGSATGQPLPAGGRMRAIADDGQTLWAAGLVDGGMAAVEQARRAPTTVPGGRSPATAPAAAGEPRLVVFHEVDGGWVAVAEVPRELTPGAAVPVAMAVGERLPLVAFADDLGGIRVVRSQGDRTWSQTVLTRPAATGPAVAAFDLVETDRGPVLWSTTGAGAGRAVVVPPGSNRSSPPAGATAGPPLQWPGAEQPEGTAAVDDAGEYLRVYARHGDDDVLEQRYDPADGLKPVGTPASLVGGGEDARGSLPSWLQLLVLVSLTFAAGAGVYRHLSAGPKDRPAAAADAPRPAGLLPRLQAGLVDLIPLALAVVVALLLARRDGPSANPAILFVVGVGVLAYVGLTTAVEAVTGRTMGKRMVGLDVVRINGTRPSVGQLVGRNLLRVCDPVVFLVISPLGQRSADVAVGTMVVAAAGESEDGGGAG